ncbi:MAG: hypothetical protein ABIF85_06840 [Nanoarchaeota archaeon]|nr:hypothetical protein [Nanoarchaeota archaeon]MBU4451694.1 hypothetical protein [Nanoarchaeota archaeon]MCG2723601.1 hypothetical protein [archaeon]
MLEVFLFLEGMFAVFLVIIGMGRLAESKKDENIVYEHLFLKEIERQSPQMYKILTEKTRKFNETEEKWVYDILKELVLDNKKYGSDATEILREFKKNVLDECTEKQEYGILSPQSRKYASSKQFETNPEKAYNQAQKELREIEEVVVGTRTKLAEKEEKNRQFPIPNKEHGIDVIEKGPAKRIYEAKEKIKRQPYDNIMPEEALKIKSNMEDTVSRGLVSPEIADKYIKGCEKAAGIKREYVPTKEGAEKQAVLKESNKLYSDRLENKRKEAKKERDNRFNGPGKGREIAESDGHESIYQKIKNLFSGR